MDRIDDPTAEADKFGAGKDGFTEGDPGLVDPTAVSAAWLDGVQEEIVAVIEDAGLTPSNASLAQLLAALKIFTRYVVVDVSGSAAGSSVNFALSQASSNGDLINGDFTLASNEVTVPDAGCYLVIISINMTNDAVADPSPFTVKVETTAAGAIASGRFLRYSNVGSDASNVVAFGLHHLAAATALRVRHLEPDTLTASGRNLVLQLTRA